MENNAVYVKMLCSLLEKKASVMKEIISVTKRQEDIIQQSVVDWDAFDETLEQKEKLIDQINELDLGFDRIYQKVSEEMKLRKYLYADQIKKMQEYIKYLTDTSVAVQAQEQRNKLRMDQCFKMRRQEIKLRKEGQKTAAKYYNNMSSGYDSNSMYMDKKK